MRLTGVSSAPAPQLGGDLVGLVGHDRPLDGRRAEGAQRLLERVAARVVALAARALVAHREHGRHDEAVLHQDDAVAGRDLAALDDLREDALARHHAVTRLVEDGAAVVTLLADLGHLEKRLSGVEPRPDRQLVEHEPLGGHVLAERAGVDGRAGGQHLLDALVGQQAHLAVPGPGVRVALDPVVDDERDGLDGLLAHALGLRDVDRDDGAVDVVMAHCSPPDDPATPASLSVSPAPSRRQCPLRPPLFSSSRTPVTSMPRSTALHMS